MTVRNPKREAERLELAAAVMQRSHGSLMALNVFVMKSEERLRQEVLGRYLSAVEERENMLRQAVLPLARTGVRVTSHVAPAQTALRGIISATEVARASLLFLGWPEPGPDGAGQVELFRDLERTARAHLLIFRPGGIRPPRRVMVLADHTADAELARLLATRAAESWQAELVLATLVPEDSDADARAEAEAALEARIGTTVWSKVKALPAGSVSAAVVEASRTAGAWPPGCWISWRRSSPSRGARCCWSGRTRPFRWSPGCREGRARISGPDFS